jgi:hypothetical protein
MGRVQDAVGDALAAEITGRQEWDERPELFALYYRGGKGHLGLLALPDSIWSTAPPAQVLAALADAGDACADLVRKVAPAELFGVAFFTEVWMASAAGTAAVEDLERRTRAVGGRVSELPDRVEARSMWAVDRAGTTYTAYQARGSDEVVRAVSYPKPGQPSWTGAVPAALDRLVTALLGVMMPDRGLR